jgi:hypothetical protein
MTTAISGCSLFDLKQITIIIPNKRQGPVPFGDMSNLKFQVVTFIQERIQIFNFQADMPDSFKTVHGLADNENLKMNLFAPVVDDQQFGFNIENGF